MKFFLLFLVLVFCTKCGSCLKTCQHFIFVIIYLLLPINCIIFDSVSKILFIIFLLPIIIMILIMKILLHNERKIIVLWYPTYVYQFFKFLIITKIECWPVFKQDPKMYEFGRFGCNRKLFAQQVVAHAPYLGGTGRVNGPMNMIATTVFCCPNRASLLSMQHNFYCPSENLK